MKENTMEDDIWMIKELLAEMVLRLKLESGEIYCCQCNKTIEPREKWAINDIPATVTAYRNGAYCAKCKEDI